MNKEEKLAKDILHAVGSLDNVQNVIHCMTRVRLKIKDYNKVDYDQLKAIDGVMGVVEDDRLQVVVGPGTSNKVANVISKMSGVDLGEDIPSNNKQRVEDEAQKNKSNFQKHKQKPLQRFFKVIANIFIPLIPAFVGAGLIGGIGALLTNLVTAEVIGGAFITQLILIFDLIKNGMLAYLAIFVGINAAKQFGATPGLGGVIGGTTLLTGLTEDKTLTNIFTGDSLLPGQGGIIGVLLAVWLLSLIEKRLHKVIPNAIDIIVTPTLSLLFIGLLTVFLIMPIAGFISNGLVGVINTIIDTGGMFSGFIIGAFFLPLVMFGLHHMFTPIHIEMINHSGQTFLLPIAAMAGAGQVGAALALWVKCRKNKEIRNMIKGALPVGFLGIGEPLIYGVTLPLGRPFITACIGGGIGGAVIGGIGHIGAYAIGPSGVSLIPLIADTKYLGYIIGLLAAYLGGFVATYLFGTTKEMVKPNNVGDVKNEYINET
ncbi:PTS transporter subunit EIIC [Staphylococcus massiliensis]|uniref:PTS system MurNAc-GlcNAc-specific EIIBC component n=1 Tax=Staphylococcus massiliensis S46 TaxID=1229783 RepID=K9ASG4_9STAP|nr:PTS transporter subunit EIIC [Staphylococcus massiliensis]EKU48991.1 hypothetical protein C273_04280 [Staphylococcus massiliensis S46]